MHLFFFAARKVQRNYFQQLSALMPDTQVLWHKSFLLPAFFSAPSQPQQLHAIVDNLLREKQNREKNKHKSAVYWAFFRFIKTLDAQLLYRRYYRGFKTLTGKIVFWNGLKYNQRIAELAARDAGLECLFMENGLIPGMTTLDVRGINYFNSMPRHAAAYPATLSTSTLHLPAMEKPNQLPAEYYFVPLQVNTDSQVTLFSPWIKNMRDLLGHIEKLDTSLHGQMGETSPVFVIKRHPAAEDKHLDILQQWAGHTRLIFADECATPALIQHAKAVITINSTVGIESLIANKPVIVLGQAFYNISGLTLSATSTPELENAVRQIEQGWQPDANLRNRFLVHLEQVYQVPGDWRATDNHGHVQNMVKRLEALR
jgi:capsular polysaccharide export protein